MYVGTYIVFQVCSKSTYAWAPRTARLKGEFSDVKPFLVLKLYSEAWHFQAVGFGCDSKGLHLRHEPVRTS